MVFPVDWSVQLFSHVSNVLKYCQIRKPCSGFVSHMMFRNQLLRNDLLGTGRALNACILYPSPVSNTWHVSGYCNVKKWDPTKVHLFFFHHSKLKLKHLRLDSRSGQGAYIPWLNEGHAVSVRILSIWLFEELHLPALPPQMLSSLHYVYHF